MAKKRRQRERSGSAASVKKAFRSAVSGAQHLLTGKVGPTSSRSSHPPSMKTVSGDLLALGAAGYFDVIVHGCNCQNAMGAGVAKSIRQRFPAAYYADVATGRGSRDKLGSYSCATVDCDDGHELTIVNAYTQFNPSRGGGGVKADYEAIRSVFALIKSDFGGKRIGYPKIGAGLAGGDWDIISEIIADELGGESHALVKYQPTSTSTRTQPRGRSVSKD